MTNHSGDDATARLVAALSDPDYVFNRDQLVHIMAAAMRWGEIDALSYEHGREAGYQQRVAEENAAYPPEPMRVVTTAAQDAVLVHRSRTGVDSGLPRENDYMGGPVPAWDADSPDPDDLGPSACTWHPRAGVPVVRTRSGWAWRDEA